MADSKDDLETLFARRREIDRALIEQHSREIVIVFTDIVGSTQYFEAKGDIAGLELVRRHNDLLFPIVKSHGGWIVKTIGDAIMAVFDEPLTAVRCLMQMQRALHRENASGQEPIHIRGGAHFGRAIVDGDRDVFGDAVNTAARVASQVKPDEILISRALADRLPASASAEVPLIPRGSFQPKGKADPVEVLAVHWREDLAPPPAPALSAPAAGSPALTSPQPVASHTAASQAGAAAPTGAVADSARGSKEIFILEIEVGAKGLKIAALDGAADKGTVKAYADVPYSMARLDETAQRFVTFMRAGGTESYVSRVRELGSALFQSALSERARRHLVETQQRFVRLHLDDQLVHVPWELMHDGEEFLALRFAMGRMVSARAETSPSVRLSGAQAAPHALVVSNASGDLEAAVREGEAVAGLLRDGYAGEVRHLRGPVTRAAFLDALRGCTLLHFAGHAEQPSPQSPGGFRLSDGLATPEQVTQAVGAAAPALVFANGCHASSADGFRGDEARTADLASALLLRGARHFVGPRWEIADEDALAFALRFYEKALTGLELGEAVRQARLALRAPNAKPLSFAGYVLYGDPRGGFPRETIKLGAPSATRSRTRDDIVETKSTALRRTGPPRRAPALMVGGAVAALALGVGGFALFGRGDGGPPVTENSGSSNAEAAATPPVTGKTTEPPRVPATGPVRVTVFKFKNISGDADLDQYCEGITEAVMSDFGSNEDIRLIERAQVDSQIWLIDFEQTKYVDQQIRTELGKIHGAEVALIGGVQRAGSVVRFNARFINVETGEVIDGARVEAAIPRSRPERILELQDELAEKVAALTPRVLERMRPQPVAEPTSP